MRAKKIFIRGGELIIGTEEEPFNRTAQITLHGLMDDETLTLGGTVSGGNKVLATVGDVKMYGLTRSASTRLLVPAYKDAT